MINGSGRNCGMPPYLTIPARYVNAIKLTTCFLHERSQRQAYVIDEVAYTMDSFHSSYNRMLVILMG